MIEFVAELFEQFYSIDHLKTMLSSAFLAVVLVFVVVLELLQLLLHRRHSNIPVDIC